MRRKNLQTLTGGGLLRETGSFAEEDVGLQIEWSVRTCSNAVKPHVLNWKNCMLSMVGWLKDLDLPCMELR